MTTEHLLQACPLHDNHRRQLRLVEIDSGGEEALDNLDNLQCLVVLLQSKDTVGLAPYYNDKCHCLKSKVKEDMDL